MNRATPWVPTAQPVLRSRKWTDLMGAEVPVVCILHVSPLSSVFMTVPKVPTAQPVSASTNVASMKDGESPSFIVHVFVSGFCRKTATASAATANRAPISTKILTG